MLGQIFDPKTAAQIENLKCQASFFPDLGDESEHHFGSVLERLDVKDL